MNKSVLYLLSIVLGWCALLSPAFAQAQFKLLVLAAPNKYHYEYIPVARESVDKLGKLHNFEFTWTNQLSALEGDLTPYAAIVLMNTSGEEFSETQRRKFEDYVKGGGNVAIVHRAIIIPADKWPWYERLVGRSFKIHPIIQSAVIHTVDPNHPATFGVPPRWIWSDEWYELSNPHKVAIQPILNVDESTYDPTRIWPGQVAKGMGREHPVAWFHQVDGARVFVTSLGHSVHMYRDEQYLNHLYGGIWWAATGKGQLK